MTSQDSAPYNGDNKLWAKESRAYFLYGWDEIKRNREPEGVEQAIPDPVTSDDNRSPYRVYADTLMHRFIAEYVPTPASIIDIGCGPGKYAWFFKDYEGDYHGVDVEDYIGWDVARQAAEDWPLEVHFHHLPGEQLDTFPVDANFSLSSSSLEHVDDPDAVIRGLAKHTQAGTYGLHIVPGPWSLITYGRHGWRRFSADRLKSMFEDAGFETVKLYRLGGLPSSLYHLWWISHMEEGLALQSLTLSSLPFILYRINTALCVQGLRTSKFTAPLYRAGLRIALKLDRFAPRMAVGYAIVVRRKTNTVS